MSGPSIRNRHEEVHDKENSKVTISDISTTSVKSTPYRIVISDVKVKKGG